MKKLLLFLILSTFYVGANAQVWVSQATGFSATSVGVRNISVVDANTAWISTYDGSGGTANKRDFSRTIDGGVTWTPGVVPAPVSNNWSMISAVDAQNAWAAFYNANGGGGGIWHTADGGATWAQQGVGVIFTSTATSFPNVVHFWNANEGMVMGDPTAANAFEIYTTTDGGTTWTAATAPAALANEFGIVDHASFFGNSAWFTTDAGRVFHSTDKGLTWSVSTTGMNVGDQFDICFYSEANGIIRFYDASGSNVLFQTTNDSGATWVTAFANGDFFGADVKYVPGTAARLVSTGSLAGFVGSSYSNDGGLNWTTIETNDQRTALGIVDSNTMWAGGFSSTSTVGGVYKYSVVACGDVSISAGNATVANAVVCAGDTARFSISGVVAPTPGDYSGFAWVISSADISGNNDPLNDPSFVTSYSFNVGGPQSGSLLFPNDGAFIGSTLPYGNYYWTPVVFGNATSANPPPTFLEDLTLDTGCTYTGTSVMVNISNCVPPPVNDECIGAVIINAAFAGAPGVAVSAGIFDNTTATHSNLDPLTGYSCYGEPDGSGSADDSLKLDNTMWFKFTGTGLSYKIETANCSGVTNYIDDGDTQMSIYTGSCGSLVEDSCNEDIAPGGVTYESGFPIFNTVSGTVYYIMIDGFNFNGALSTGQYCLLVTKLTGVGITENLPGKNASIMVYPSPAHNTVKVEFTTNESSDAVISITDYLGRMVQSTTIAAQNGANMTELNVRSLVSGSYLVNVRTNSSSRTVKFIKD